jgi:hypothetical protein
LGFSLTITSTNASFRGYTNLLALRIVMDDDTDTDYYKSDGQVGLHLGSGVDMVHQTRKTTTRVGEV